MVAHRMIRGQNVDPGMAIAYLMNSQAGYLNHYPDPFFHGHP